MRIRQLLARARTATFEVESMATLGLAQERASAGGIDVALLDLDLPDSIGLTTYASFACVAPQLPVVVLTRATDEALAFDAVQHGAQDLVFKAQLSAESLTRAIRCAVERHRLVTSLRGLSLTDELTGLLNRRGFATIAQGHLRLASRTGNRFLLFFADVDGLKQINDRYGHHAGDDALVRVAEALRRTFRQSDVVARYGGDEFAILALDTSADEGATIRRRLGQALTEANAREGHPVGLSVGTIALDGRLEEPLGSLLARADRALYGEKSHRAATGPAGRSGTAVRHR